MESTAIGVLGGVILIVLGAYLILIAVNPQPLLRAVMRLIPSPSHPQASDALNRGRTAKLGWMAAIRLDMLVL